ncbi:protein S-acyltransferase 10 isoform X2 [Amborella trichopoda]|uniref:protein S-acyltransferase 10 isoform X2 n=1 Tax=Amborella trichopoda TaxID=13333 RepID=UPI0009C18101|nr:protein S-acyltransferase 10 isoform X2 [Amborella trichopoda]|eukprot:XP_020532306.1 protein S-acyltransferase 10 isoform X2 [Amborella trichopoda]
MDGFCHPIRDVWERFLQRCYEAFPCLSDPGALLILDRNMLNATRDNPWYFATYWFLFFVTLLQYFYTSGSSPGFVIDAMRAGCEIQSTSRRPPKTTKQSASVKDASLIIPIYSHQPVSTACSVEATSWVKLIMDMYPPGSSSRHWTCTYCNVVQPPRSKHCHDCDKCVLQFDHHCVWLGTCIGQGNHSRFWWYIFEETVLCIWTGIMYITFLRNSMSRAWWRDVVAIMLLVVLCICLIFLLLLLIFHSYLVLTNQTTHELIRKQRISYLRGIPDRVHPFSKGVCRNLYNFCCASRSIYTIEPLPTLEEIEDKKRPYTCWDIVTCRCC